MTEMSFQDENRVLDKLRDSIHYTYSFFPSDDSKAEMPMYIWQLPTYSYDLTCDPQSAMTELRDSKHDSYDDRPWIGAQEYGGKVAIAALALTFGGLVMFPSYPVVALINIGLLWWPTNMARQVQKDMKDGTFGAKLSPGLYACLDQKT